MLIWYVFVGEPRESNSIKEIMNGYSSSGFKRPERLDVKKPGPSFSTNNYAFQKESSEVNKGKWHFKVCFPL